MYFFVIWSLSIKRVCFWIGSLLKSVEDDDARSTLMPRGHVCVITTILFFKISNSMLLVN